ncbi:MAG: DUF3373 family protein, partial [Sulfurimonas sp.]|nr:DUF3373 family protein [Sulfurimonas sp.]
MKKIISIATATLLSTSLFANTDMQTQIDDLTKEVQKLKKDSKRTKKSLSAVKKATGGDNIKFGVDFRNAIDSLEYKDNDTGETASNNSLLTSRLYLTMGAAPMDGLIFKGKLAIYSIWGAHAYYDDASQPSLKDWAASSKASDSVMRVKEAYFVYTSALGEQPISVSVGRRPSSNGFLSNYRENEKEPGSPLAHTVNMEVNAAMVKLDWDRFVGGAYTKLVYGRAHTGEIQNVYGTGTTPWGDGGPYAEIDSDNKNVDFALMLGDAYNDGQYQVMYQWAHIFDTKGQQFEDISTKTAAAGVADLLSLGLKVDGIGDEISDFLDDTTVFISGAYTNYDAKNGYQLLGSTNGGSQSGQSIWVGAIVPDGFTDAGKFGFEYNQGSKYWTPMTWAEDTA